jgi:hypothetical protein
VIVVWSLIVDRALPLTRPAQPSIRQVRLG